VISLNPFKRLDAIRRNTEYYPYNYYKIHCFPPVQLFLAFCFNPRQPIFMTAIEKLMELLQADTGSVEKLKTDIRMSEARAAGFRESLALVEGDQTAMAQKGRLLDRLQREYATAQKLQKQITDCEGRISAYTEALKILGNNDADVELRPNSRMEQVRTLLRTHGKPMSLAEILKSLNLEGDEKLRNSLRGSLSGYARDSRVFTKEDAPDTFGLMEFTRQNGQ
jgi:hypothetical protein